MTAENAVHNHDFCKSEIEIFFAEGLDMHVAVETVHEIRALAQAVARATCIRGGETGGTCAGDMPWAVLGKALSA
jgi:hypothetical protein